MRPEKHGRMRWRIVRVDLRGKIDWRLPNKKELMSLVNFERYSPASDFPDMPLIVLVVIVLRQTVPFTRGAWISATA